MRRAFTLIELLVVVSIVALLLSISVPVLAATRAAGKRAVCLSNLRQLHIPLVCYLNDNRWFEFPHLAPCVIDDGPDFRTIMVGPEPSAEHAIGPWSCPADTSLRPVARTSYVYVAGLWFSEQCWLVWRPKPFEDTPDMAVVGDAGTGHGDGWPVVRLDGSVR